ncbi:FadR/GntR family transcriptional regulator [Pararobbsia alpina]|uniref:FadR/GntR family transcriptional regulator n=1 Tax=Pararobbsia alpina TaxID=621374 RepID=UPI001FE7758C|nr:FCD domain-containing protein [Pararobbsia alpina]
MAAADGTTGVRSDETLDARCLPGRTHSAAGDKRNHWFGVERDNARCVADDYQFHQAILKAAHNPALLETCKFLSIAMNETIASTPKVDIPEPDYDAHRSLIDAIESRSSDIAEKAVRDFMNFILVALPEVSRS